MLPLATSVRSYVLALLSTNVHACSRLGQTSSSTLLDAGIVCLSPEMPPCAFITLSMSCTVRMDCKTGDGRIKLPELVRDIQQNLCFPLFDSVPGSVSTGRTPPVGLSSAALASPPSFIYAHPPSHSRIEESQDLSRTCDTSFPLLHVASFPYGTGHLENILLLTVTSSDLSHQKRRKCYRLLPKEKKQWLTT